MGLVVGRLGHIVCCKVRPASIQSLQNNPLPHTFCWRDTFFVRDLNHHHHFLFMLLVWATSNCLFYTPRWGGPLTNGYLILQVGLPESAIYDEVRRYIHCRHHRAEQHRRQGEIAEWSERTHRHHPPLRGAATPPREEIQDRRHFDMSGELVFGWHIWAVGVAALLVMKCALLTLPEDENIYPLVMLNLVTVKSSRWTALCLVGILMKKFIPTLHKKFNQQLVPHTL